jgi:hypothetical protein
MLNDVRRSGTPETPLTLLCNKLLSVLEQEDAPGVKAIVMLDNGTDGGIGIYGYADDMEAIGDMFVHLAAIFEANGKGLMIVPLATMGQG